MAVLVAFLALTVGHAYYSASGPAALMPVNISLPGLASSSNIKFASNGQFALTASFEPSTATKLDQVVDFSSLDNSNITSLNVQDPSTGTAQLGLADSQGNRYFYPRNLFFNAASGTVFVRATKIGPDGFEDGEYICYGPVSADGSNWKGAIVPLRIPEVGDGSEAAYMPASFGLGRDSKILVYTNGSEVFLASLTEGFGYKIGPFTQGDVGLFEGYGTDYNGISDVSVDRDTNTVVVNVNTRKTDNATGTSFSSRTYFYRLNEEPGPAYGTMDLLRVVGSADMQGASLPPYSNVLIVGTEAFFSPDDGSIRSVDLAHAGPVRVLATVPELAAAPLTPGTPHLLAYDAPSKTLAIVKKGQIFDVRRPTYVRRPTTVRRPTYVFAQEKAAVALVNSNGQGNVRVLQGEDFGAASTGFSNGIFDANSNLILATLDGALVSVGARGVTTLCGIPTLTDKLEFDLDHMILAGVSSFNVNLARGKITTAGSILLVGTDASKDSTGSVSSLLATPAAGLARGSGSIRRPGNIVW